MGAATAIPVPRLIDAVGLGDLCQALASEGYRVIGPAVQDGAITLRELSSAAELPFGWGVRLEPGGYQLRHRDDTAAFGHSAGPQSWKRFLHPPRERLWSATRTAEGFDLDGAEDDEPPRYAFLGLRPCDLRAIAIQDRVLAQPGSRYAARRARLFIVAVNCTEPGETCFCASMGTGPGAEGDAYDLALTELVDERGHRFLVEVASRCLTCGNCTMACPTCFCTTIEDTTDLTGEYAERWERWDSCFDLDFSYLHGGSVRTSPKSRYRQWLTHKLGTWHDQFGSSGCVGCGRCIVWCPAFGRGCYGCFGPVAAPNLAALTGQLRHLGMTEGEVDRVFTTFNAAAEALVAARSQRPQQSPRR